MPYRLYKIIFPLGVLAIIVSIVLFWLIYETPKNLEVDFLDVGQGDAELIKTPFGQNVLIDGGPNSSVIKSLSKSLPWWDRTIDLVILTHPHDDHVAGLNDVLKRYKVKQIALTGVSHTSPAYLSFLENIRNQQIPVVRIDRPQFIQLGDVCRLNIFWPSSDLAGQSVENLNNTSIIFRLEYAKNYFLFVGDTESETEKKILAQPELLRADVLKVSHHGSDLTTSQEFLNLVQPRLAVIEVGKDNKFGHPSPRVVSRLERAGVKIWRTDRDSTVRIISNGQRVWQEK